jgi:7,8-dihydro-6-hydroxymethylpterin-pyrophosphokinase
MCSDIFESNAIGFEGADFYNMGVNATTDLSVEYYTTLTGL